jgi:hypothetical protein
MFMKAKDVADLLYHYFIQNNSLSLPGIGTFDMFRISAQTDFANKKMLPPTFTISYNSIHDAPHKELFDYIAHKKNIPEWEAIKLVNDFAGDLKNTLYQGMPVAWEGIGLLKQGKGKDILFEPHRLSYEFIPHVNAQRVIRQSANHAMLVGDRERSKSEMEIYLSDDIHAVNVRSGWWSIASIIAAIAFLLLSVRAFTEGLSYMSGRKQNIHPVEATSTYTIQTPSQPAP